MLSGPQGSLPVGAAPLASPWTLGRESQLGRSLPHPQTSAELKAQLAPWSHLHVAGLVGHHEGRGEAIFVVKGTASQGVAHASNRRVPCQGEGERAERERSRAGEVGLDEVCAEPATAGTSGPGHHWRVPGGRRILPTHPPVCTHPQYSSWAKLPPRPKACRPPSWPAALCACRPRACIQPTSELHPSRQSVRW